MRACWACVLVLSTPAGACPGLELTDGWIREAPPGVTVLAGYGRLHNGGRAALAVTGARSPAFGAVELHRTVIEGGVARMRHGEPLALAPGQDTALEPGGWHLMLFRPARALHAGDPVSVLLECDGDSAGFTFTVRTGE